MSRYKAEQRLKIEDDKHLTVSENTVSEDYPLHWHSYFEIEIVASGKGRQIINDIEYDVEEQNMFFLTSTDFHYFKAEETAKVINISFDEEMVDEETLSFLLFSETERAYRLDEEEYRRIVGACSILAHECECGGDCQRSILQYILKCMQRKNKPQTSNGGADAHYRGIKQAIAYMEMHFREKITLETLAAEAGYHPTYFSELFKKTTGATYIETLNKLRVGNARTLLSNGFSVSDTCFMSGFASLSNFLTVFKKHCKISPREYKAHTRKS